MPWPVSRTTRSVKLVFCPGRVVIPMPWTNVDYLQMTDEVDLDDKSREFGNRFMKRTGRMPNMIHAGTYSATLQ